MLKLRYYDSRQTKPYLNMAIEKYLFDTVSEGEIILYLWQNDKTVVCGRNQNVYKECRLSLLEENSVLLARRLSGGGAVYHDFGNINFTFIAHRENFDVQRQLSVIAAACSSFGIQAEISGRNDIIAAGRKFSGNAFYKSEGKCLQHGTIMLKVDCGELSKYLNPDREKLKAKGIASVQSRVINLCELNPDISPEKMKKALFKAFEKEYSAEAETIVFGETEMREAGEREHFFESPGWIYGEKLSFTNVISKRFEWGSFEISARVENGIIAELKVNSDALNADYIEKITEALKNIRYNAADMAGAIKAVSDGEEEKYNQIEKLLFEEI